MDVKGYDFEFVDELSSDHTCSICLLGMRNPVQTAKCGHRFCDGCLFKALREADKRVCPLDSIPIPQEGGFFRDVAWERDILSHRVKCKRNERGCDWMGELRQYEEHFKNSCPYEDVVCIRCNDIKQRKFLQEHATSECSKRIVQCKYCVKEFEFWRTEIHEGEECNLFPLDCPQQCGISKMAREKLGFHIKDDCLMTLVTCPYSDAGCTFHDKRINLEGHIKDSAEDHLHKAWTQIAEENRNLKKEVSELAKQLSDTKMSSQRNNEEINKIRPLMTKLEEENRNLKKEVSGLAKQLADTKMIAEKNKNELDSNRFFAQFSRK